MTAVLKLVFRSLHGETISFETYNISRSSFMIGWMDAMDENGFSRVNNENIKDRGCMGSALRITIFTEFGKDMQHVTSQI